MFEILDKTDVISDASVETVQTYVLVLKTVYLTLRSSFMKNKDYAFFMRTVPIKSEK